MVDQENKRKKETNSVLIQSLVSQAIEFSLNKNETGIGEYGIYDENGTFKGIESEPAAAFG